MRNFSGALACFLSIGLIACGSSPAAYSAPVGISLVAKSGDVAGGQIRVDKNINTESGNPYGAFTNAAVQHLGHDPGRIDVTSATLTLGSSSSGVTALQQVFGGTAQVSFVMNGSGNTYPVATAASPNGAGPVAMTVGFDSASLPPADFADLAGGSFKVALSGPAAGGFASASATANMTVTFTFEAFP